MNKITVVIDAIDGEYIFCDLGEPRFLTPEEFHHIFKKLKREGKRIIVRTYKGKIEVHDIIIDTKDEIDNYTEKIKYKDGKFIYIFGKYIRRYYRR